MMPLPRNLKIMYIDGSSKVGGAEVYLRNLARYFAKMCSVTVVHNEIPAHNRFYQDEYVRQISVGKELTKHRLASFFSYVSILKKHKPDIVHINLPAPTLCLEAIFAANYASQAKIVTTIHLPSVRYCWSWKGIVVGKKFVTKLIQQMVYRTLDKVIVVNRSGIQQISENYNVKPERVCCIFNGVNPDDYIAPVKLNIDRSKGELGLVGSQIVVTTIGRLHEQKGFMHLLRAFAIVKNELNDIKLLIVGDGVLECSLRKLVEELNIVEDVIFCGYRKDIPEILALTDVYVNTSINEGLPFTILEAMASGVAVVATAIEGNREVVVDGITGILVKPADPESIATAILELATNKSLRNVLGSRAQAVIAERYTSQQMMDNTAQLYSDLIVN